MNIEPTDALIVVDVQNDFCPGGALPVPDGWRVASPINKVVIGFDHYFFTRDWHPFDHCSFSDTPEFADGSWPEHCMEDSPGAEFLVDLHVPSDAAVVSKGMDPDKEAYSGFEETDLAEQLHARGVRRVFVCGLATDFCVKATALDALRLGFTVVIIRDACRAVDKPAGSGDAAFEEMRAAGAQFCRSGDLVDE